VDWRDYQRAAAEFFMNLGMEAKVDEKLSGARGEHDVDVVIRFTAYGIAHLWIVECKHWDRAIPKEKVLVLQQLAADVGAHRAFLLCEKGFQSGAVTSARMSNVTLTNLEDLHDNAQADVQLARWDDMFVRLAAVADKVQSLNVVTDTGEYVGMSVLKPGIENNDFFQRVGTISILQTSLQRARVGQFPVICGPDESREGAILAQDLETFFSQAEPVLTDVEQWAIEKVTMPWPDRPEPAKAQPAARNRLVILPESETD
jgi:hypothetical protein